MQRFSYYIPIFLQKIGYSIFYCAYRFFVHLQIRGSEQLQGITGPVILAANHTSELDPTAVPLVLPFFSSLYPIYFVSNPVEKYKTFGWRSYFYGGVFFNLLGAYPIFSGYHNYAVSLGNHVNLLQMGRTVCIFPEGKRTRDGQLNPAHGGLGYLAYKTNATVIPITIDTFFNITVWDFFLRRRKVILTVEKPLTKNDLFDHLFDKPTVEDFRDASQKVLDAIGESLS